MPKIAWSSCAAKCCWTWWPRSGGENTRNLIQKNAPGELVLKYGGTQKKWGKIEEEDRDRCCRTRDPMGQNVRNIKKCVPGPKIIGQKHLFAPNYHPLAKYWSSANQSLIKKNNVTSVSREIPWVSLKYRSTDKLMHHFQTNQTNSTFKLN